MGNTLGASLLGAVYTSQLAGSLADAGPAAQSVAVSATSITPQAL